MTLFILLAVGSMFVTPLKGVKYYDSCTLGGLNAVVYFGTPLSSTALNDPHKSVYVSIFAHILHFEIVNAIEQTMFATSTKSEMAVSTFIS